MIRKYRLCSWWLYYYPLYLCKYREKSSLERTASLLLSQCCSHSVLPLMYFSVSGILDFLNKKEINGNCIVFCNLTCEHMQSWHCPFWTPEPSQGAISIYPTVRNILEWYFWTEVTNVWPLGKKRAEHQLSKPRLLLAHCESAPRQGRRLLLTFRLTQWQNITVFLWADSLPA